MSGPWDDYAPNSASNAGPWNDYASEPKKETSNPFRAGLRSLSPVLAAIADNPQGALVAGGQLLKGGVRGVKDVIDTGAQLAAQLFSDSEGQRVRAMNDAGKADFKRDNTDFGASIGRFGGQMAATMPVGPLFGAAATAMGLGRVGLALTSSGMITGGPVASGFRAGAADLALRSAAGGAVGGATAGLVNQDDALMGAGIGAALPGALQLAGKVGGSVYSAAKSGQSSSGRLLAEALGVSEAELPALIKAANAAPEFIVPGSKLTLSQALQTQGANTPGVKMLERIASSGPGGDALLKRYADQGSARMVALEAQGAQTYQGAARQESTTTGNSLGSVLRTQASDDQQAARQAWDALYGRAGEEGVALQLPIEQMQSAMSPLGRGSVVAANDARNVMRTADDIGHLVIPAMDALPPATARNSQTLEQAVRSMGGIRGSSGELRDLGIRQSGTTGMINNKSGQSADLLAEEMYRRGFIPDGDPATLMDALRNGGGRKRFANDQVESNGMQRMSEEAMGDLPGAKKILQAVPFEEFQRLRRDAGSLAAKVGERAGGETEAGVLNKFRGLLESRVDDAASGNLLSGEVMSEAFRSQYNAARGMTRANAERYKGGNNIASVLRKPVGQDFTLTGDEITNKLWHGGSGLAGDVSNFKNALSENNFPPAMDKLQRFIMTDAAGKTKGSGDMGAALPRYVEQRMPGLLEALDDSQFKALTGVASDIRNADAAAAVTGLLGSDTYAKTVRAMDGGLLDSPAAKMAGRLLSFKGLGAEPVRAKMSEMVMQHKGRTVAELLTNPKAAAAALQDATFLKSVGAKTSRDLRMAVAAARAAPILATD